MVTKKSRKKNLTNLIKSLRLQPKSRFLLGQVNAHNVKTDLQFYKEHRVNVIYAKPKIDNKPPKFQLDVYYKETKLQNISKRVNDLDNNNMELLKILNIINRLPPKVDCWNKIIPKYEDKNKEKVAANKRIMEDNRDMMRVIKKATPKYRTADLLKEWEKKETMLRKKLNILSCPTDSDGTHISIIKNPIKTENPELRTKCFFDIQIDETKKKIGRIVFELYSDYVPRTCANFEQLCLGTNGLSYKGTQFYQIIPGYWCQGGDVSNFNGTGDSSVYGDTFEDENFSLKHACRGVISKWSDGNSTNNSKFNITFRKLESMDGKKVVFGKVVRGLSKLSMIEVEGTKSGRILKHIIVVNCGVLRSKSKNLNMKS